MILPHGFPGLKFAFAKEGSEHEAPRLFGRAVHRDLKERETSVSVAIWARAWRRSRRHLL